jgi:hypothetical protein
MIGGRFATANAGPDGDKMGDLVELSAAGAAAAAVNCRHRSSKDLVAAFGDLLGFCAKDRRIWGGTPIIELAKPWWGHRFRIRAGHSGRQAAMPKIVEEVSDVD